MDGITLLHIVAALGVIALLLCALAVLPRLEAYLPGSRGKLVTLVETTMLANASALHVVKILDRYYVLGSTGEQVSVICPLSQEGVDEHIERSRTKVR